MKKPPIHYIVFPDKSWIDPDGYANYPAEHRMKLDGAACMTEKDFKSGAYLNESWWNPKIETRKGPHFIVWRHVYKTGRTSVAAQDEGQFRTYQMNDPNHFVGASCIRAVSLAQAEELAGQASVWEPIDPEIIKNHQAMFRIEKERARSHYPEVW